MTLQTRQALQWTTRAASHEGRKQTEGCVPECLAANPPKLAMECDRFCEFLVLYAKQIVQGVAPRKKFMLACRGTALDKDGKGGIRPIAVGDLIYRLLGKAILKLYSRKDCLLPYQLGVGSAGGVEPVVRVVERALSGDLPEKSEYVVQLDFTNAFNAASRVDCAKAVKTYCPGRRERRCRLCRPGRFPS
jgi:hypothetical protein